MASMLRTSPWEARPFLNGGGGGVGGEGSRWERGGGGRTGGRANWLVCKISFKNII